MTSNYQQAPQGGRVLIDIDGSYYFLEQVIAVANRSRIAKVPANDLVEGQVMYRPVTQGAAAADAVDAVIYTRLEGKLLVLAGRQILRAAMEKGSSEVPGRFVSNYALKQTKS